MRASLEAEVAELAVSSRFSGAIRVDNAEGIVLEVAYGFAHRGYRIPNRVDTQFAIASGTKGFTACVLVSLVADGTLSLETTARSLLADDVPLIGPDVTVEHLLAHRSGIGDYVDEETIHDPTAYVLSVPVHELATTEAYLAVLDGHQKKFAPGERFSYCNGGYVVLALLAERATGRRFPQLVHERVCEPAGMLHTAFVRSDEPTGASAVGYLSVDNDRTNVFHLPVLGSGDGGILTTVADVHAFWRAFFAGRIVPEPWVGEMTRARLPATGASAEYGLGFWLDERRHTAMLEGADAGVSFRSVHDPQTNSTYTVMSNSTDGAWPIARLLQRWYEPSR